MENKFCCDKFHWDWKVDHSCGTNIRIVKLFPEEVRMIDPNYPYRFWITVGYSKGEKNVNRRMIEFCPYCGIHLDEYYRSDEYINESDKSFLMVD